MRRSSQISRRELLAATAGALAVGSPIGAGAEEGSTVETTGSDIGSLYPFVQSQAVKGEPRLSFLRDEFHDASAWRRKARAKLLETLSYAPPKCDSRPEVVERVDRGDY